MHWNLDKLQKSVIILSQAVAVLVVVVLCCCRVLVGHYEGNPNEVCLLQSGEGGVEELAEHIDDEQCLYGLGEPAHCIVALWPG